MKPWAVLSLGVVFLALLSLLPTAEVAPQLAGMKTITKTKKPVRKLSMSPAAVRSRRNRAEDKADYAIAVKRLAELDSGKTKAIPAEEVWRDLGI